MFSPVTALEGITQLAPTYLQPTCDHFSLFKFCFYWPFTPLFLLTGSPSLHSVLLFLASLGPSPKVTPEFLPVKSHHTQPGVTSSVFIVFCTERTSKDFALLRMCLLCLLSPPPHCDLPEARSMFTTISQEAAQCPAGTQKGRDQAGSGLPYPESSHFNFMTWKCLPVTSRQRKRRISKHYHFSNLPQVV